LIRRKCSKLIDFVELAWHLIEPARPFIRNWCAEAVCEHLEAVSYGRIRKLIINIPPGFAKSSIVSVLWPAWEWTKLPFIRWMFATHSSVLSIRDSARRRDVVIGSPWYQELWGDVFTLTSDNVKYFTNSHQGSMFSSSTESQDVTGFRAERLCLDDPHDPQGAISEVQRASTTEWLNKTWPTRLNETKYSGEVVVMQRLHPMDASGLYLSQGGWTHLKIPMEYKSRTFVPADPRNSAGQLIDERVYSRAYVDDKKIRLGPWGEASQYDQEPMTIGGGIIKPAWFGRWAYSTEQPGYIRAGQYQFDPKATFRFATVDLAMTEKEIGPKKLNDPDWTVMAAWACIATPLGPFLVLLDILRVRSEGPESLDKVEAFQHHWKFSMIAVEDIAEKAWYQFARKRGLPVREVSTKKNDDVVYTIDKDKVGRAIAATVLMARPDRPFYIPEYAPWLAEFLDELIQFPNGSHDDQVDVVSMACAIAEKFKGRNPYADEPPAPSRSFDDGYRRPSDDDGAIKPLDGWFAGR
jgi:predicted phage terminase large subunit-like protein